MNNNSKAAATRTQVVYSEPRRIKTGTRLLKNGITMVNTYKDNPNAKPIKEIQHAIVRTDNNGKIFNQFKKNKKR